MRVVMIHAIAESMSPTKLAFQEESPAGVASFSLAHDDSPEDHEPARKSHVVAPLPR
jgi:hypothetical protein